MFDCTAYVEDMLNRAFADLYGGVLMVASVFMQMALSTVLMG